MKRITLSFVLCLMYTLASAQVQLEVQTGVGSYELGDLVAWQEAAVANSPFELSTISSFPTHYAFQATALFQVKQYKIGGGLGYFSTGGRMGYWDETGSAVEDQLLKRYAFHLTGVYPLMSKGKFGLDLRSSVVFSQSNVDFTSTLTLSQQVTEEVVTYRSFNVTLLPSADLSYQLTKKIGVMLSLGFEIDFFPAALKLKTNNQEMLTNPGTSEEIKLSFTGLRALGGLYFIL